VHWNSAERSWDCPCHGSRFDVDGKVLHGPAVRALDGAAPAATGSAGRERSEERPGLPPQA
jgi:Rieske Fe-S protein